MRSSLAWRIGLLLAGLWCGAVISFLVFNSLRVETDPTAITLAGRQMGLAGELGQLADSTAWEREGDRARLRERVATFDSRLTVLEQGGEIDGDHIQPTRDGVAEAVAGVRAVWNDLRPRLVIAGRQPAGPELERTCRDLAPAIKALQMKSDELTRTLEGQIRAARLRIGWVLAAVAGTSLALLLLGLWYARRFIVRPILLIDGAAKRVRDGDFSARVQVPRGDELSSLAQTFNEMAAKTQDLLVAMELRRKHTETLSESLPLGTALLDHDLNLLRANRSFREMFELDELDSTGRPIQAILPLTGLAGRLRAVMENGEAFRGLRFDLPIPSGVRPLRITAAGTRLAEEEEEEEEARLLLVVEDLSAEQRLQAEAQAAQERLALFRSLMEQSDDGVEVVDPETARFLDANEKACAELGYTREEFLALIVPDIDPIVDKSVFPKIVAELRESGSMMLESLQHRKDGTTFPVEVSLGYVRLDRDYVIAIVRDVTERKRAQEENLRRLDELQRWQSVMLDREDRNMKLKREVNELLRRLGEPIRYPSQEEAGEGTTTGEA